ncbi:uncharacterized protein LOC123988304 isoform X2 [Osmia bicornis bicornis]|uniref:uncharacterized protein LOC123988304 isoform X2 n=1 Tax=Osmia bicornis bicornis TaxID=1437191 RepID=UPI001EAF234A|nr:uncharacterized protein LOC123988304 isoform X2 [Osmia bicornis bicornis]
MVLISFTAVRIILYVDQPAEVMRYVLFLAAQKFHLFFISLFGQILLNHALLLPETVYNSKWYEMPIRFRKVLYTMQIRCNRPCILSAVGLYEMDIQNFGKVRIDNNIGQVVALGNILAINLF